MSLGFIFILLVLFQIKHFVCDYPLQNRFMLGKFKREGWIVPLTAHSLVHVLGTMIILLLCLAGGVTFSLLGFWLICLFDFVVHFTTDRLKASPDMFGIYKIEDKKFWWVLGLDQMVHHITHYFIILFIIY